MIFLNKSLKSARKTQGSRTRNDKYRLINQNSIRSFDDVGHPYSLKYLFSLVRVKAFLFSFPLPVCLFVTLITSLSHLHITV